MNRCSICCREDFRFFSILVLALPLAFRLCFCVRYCELPDNLPAGGNERIMKTELNDVSSVRKVLKVGVPLDLIHEARSRALQEIQKKAKIPGFRPGKIPSNVIEQKFGKEIEEQTLENILDLSLGKALDEVKVNPISQPEFTPGIWSADGGYTYTVAFDVLPEIELKDYKGLKLEKREVSVLGEEVDREMERLQQAMTLLEPIPKETPLTKGHVVRLDFEGMIDGKPLKEGKSKDYSAEVGTGAILADFEKGLLGAVVGEEREIQFVYPGDYFNKDLAGKEAKFKVTIKDLRKKNVPKLDDDFAKDLGSFKTIGEVREKTERRILEGKELREKQKLHDQILDQLIAKNKFDVPPSLVASELRYLLGHFAEELKERGEKIEDFKEEEKKKLVEDGRGHAETRVRGFLLLDAICKDANINVTNEEVDERIDAIAKGSGKPKAEVMAHYEKSRLLPSLQTRILHEKALEFVLNQAKIKVVKPEKGSK